MQVINIFAHIVDHCDCRICI